jgi:hypothetical protein
VFEVLMLGVAVVLKGKCEDKTKHNEDGTLETEKQRQFEFWSFLSPYPL